MTSPTAAFVMHPNNLGPVQIISSSATYPQQVKFFDQSVPGSAVINQWLWEFGDNHSWVTTAGSSHIFVSSASTEFAVNDTVAFVGFGAAPVPFSRDTLYYVVTVASSYIELSATQGGSPITATGNSNYSTLQHCSAAQNPLFTYQAVGSPTTRTVLLTVTDVAGHYNITFKNIYQQSSLITKPAATAYNKTISIFVCTPPSAASQSACIINRVRSPNNSLFFTDFQCTGSIDKAGTLNFTVVDLGFTDSASVAARALIKQANNWVVVVVGYQVVWSGQILRIIDNNTQIYTGTTAYTQYAVQCESDIGKMKSQYVKSSAQTALTGTTGTVISSLIVPNLTTDINWNGAVESSIISREGSSIWYTISAQNMYDQFIAIANSTGFDWRTRMQYYKQSYTAFSNGWNSPNTGTVTFSGFGSSYTTNSFQNKWVLFVAPTYNVVTLSFDTGTKQVSAGDQVRIHGSTTTGTVISITVTSGSWGAGNAAGTIQLMTTQTWTSSQYIDDLQTGLNAAYVTTISSTVSVSNNTGIFSFGYCSSNTTTVVNLTSIQNSGLVSSSTGRIIVLVGSVLDYAWSLETPQPMLTLLANAPSDSGTFQGQYFSDNSDYKSLATVVTVRGKSIVPSQGTGIGSTIIATLYAKDQWDGTYNFFKKTTFVTQRMDGYVYSYAASATTIVLFGQGYALQVNDEFYVYGLKSNGTTQIYGKKTVSGISTETQTDGTLTTTITFTTGYLDTIALMKYSVFIAAKTYVSDPDWLCPSASYPTTCYVGSLSTRQFQASYTGLSADATYGNYVAITTSGQIGTTPTPAFPGTLISRDFYTPVSPDTNSPLALQNNGMPLLKSKTVDQNITQSDLDVYASMLLVNLSYYLRKANVTAKFIMDYQTGDWRDSLQNFDPGMPREGELICVLPNSSATSTDTWSDGQYKNRWQIMSWTLDGSTMQVQLELGDYEKNTYTLLNQDTASINQTLT